MMETVFFSEMVSETSFELIADHLKIIDPKYRERLYRYREVCDRLVKRTKRIPSERPVIVRGSRISGITGGMSLEILAGKQVVFTEDGILPFERVVALVLFFAAFRGVLLSQPIPVPLTCSQMNGDLSRLTGPCDGSDESDFLLSKKVELLKWVDATTERKKEIAGALSFLPKVSYIKQFCFHSECGPQGRLEYIRDSLFRYFLVKLLGGVFTHFMFLILTSEEFEEPCLGKKFSGICDILLPDETAYRKRVIIEGRHKSAGDSIIVHLWAMKCRE